MSLGPLDLTARPPWAMQADARRALAREIRAWRRRRHAILRYWSARVAPTAAQEAAEDDAYDAALLELDRFLPGSDRTAESRCEAAIRLIRHAALALPRGTR